MSAFTSLRRLAAGVAAFVLAVAAGSLAPAEEIGPSATVPATLIEQHILAMHATSIALDTEILESQINAFVGLLVYGADGQCHSLSGGGSIRVVSASYNQALTVFGGRIQTFFTATCTSLFIDETVKYTASGAAYHATPVMVVYSRAGSRMGALSLNELISNVSGKIKVLAVGAFAPQNQGSQVHVALSCQIPLVNQSSSLFASRDQRVMAIVRQLVQPTSTDIACSGGVAQSFATIAKSLGAYTPITLQLTTVGTITKVTFKQTAPARLVIGAPNALNVTVNQQGVVSITGAQTLYGTDAFAGQAAALTLFPPKPTQWGVADNPHNAKIIITLTDNTTRKLTGLITPSSGVPTLATLTLDQSGSGTIVYSTTAKAAILGWDVTN